MQYLIQQKTTIHNNFVDETQYFATSKEGVRKALVSEFNDSDIMSYSNLCKHLNKLNAGVDKLQFVGTVQIDDIECSKVLTISKLDKFKPVRFTEQPNIKQISIK